MWHSGLGRICQPATDWQKAEICLDTSLIESPKYALAYAAHNMWNDTSIANEEVVQFWADPDLDLEWIWDRFVHIFNIAREEIWKSLSTRIVMYVLSPTSSQIQIQIQMGICTARLTNCPGALTKCQNAMWNRWDFRSFFNLLVSVVSLMLAGILCLRRCLNELWRSDLSVGMFHVCSDIVRYSELLGHGSRWGVDLRRLSALPRDLLPIGWYFRVSVSLAGVGRTKSADESHNCMSGLLKDDNFN